MESPTSCEDELLTPKASRLPSDISLESAQTPHYVIATQEVTADPDSPLGTKRTGIGSVFKGSWNNSIVAVKLLSKETPGDVGRIFSSAQTLNDCCPN